jgi:hypothetical protein
MERGKLGLFGSSDNLEDRRTERGKTPTNPPMNSGGSSSASLAKPSTGITPQPSTPAPYGAGIFLNTPPNCSKGMYLHTPAQQWGGSPKTPEGNGHGQSTNYLKLKTIESAHAAPATAARKELLRADPLITSLNHLIAKSL